MCTIYGGPHHRYSHQDGQCRCTDRVCVGHTYLFFGNQTIGSGCNVWLAVQEGAGSPHRYSHQDGQCRCTDRVCVGHTYLFLGT